MLAYRVAKGYFFHMARYWGAIGAVLLIAMAASPSSFAQDVVKLGEFEDWTAYASGAGTDKVCYIVGTPEARQPDAGDREASVYITHRPGKKAMGVVMASAGYTFKAGSEATVEIGRGKFTLFTHEGTAWAADSETDERIVRAMRAGRSMTVRSTPAEGAATADVYSLLGVVAALRRIGEACPAR